MHVGCTQLWLHRPHYRQAIQEAARHLAPRHKALCLASRRSARAEWTEVFCSGMVPEAAEAQLLGLGVSRGSYATTSWNNSSARPTAWQPRYIGG